MLHFLVIFNQAAVQGTALCKHWIEAVASDNIAELLWRLSIILTWHMLTVLHWCPLIWTKTLPHWAFKQRMCLSNLGIYPPLTLPPHGITCHMDLFEEVGHAPLQWKTTPHIYSNSNNSCWGRVYNPDSPYPEAWTHGEWGPLKKDWWWLISGEPEK